MAKKLYTPEEVEKKFDALPKEIKDLLYSFEMTSIISKIGEKNGLHIDQMDKLNTETGYVMMGLTDMQDFIGILVEDLSIDQTKAEAIASDVNAMLFIKVREIMKGAQVATPAVAFTPAPAVPAARASLSSILPLSSAVTPSQAPVSTPISTPTPAYVPTTPTVSPTPIATPAVPKLEMHPADIMLTEKTVVTAPSAAAIPPVTPTPTIAKPAETKVEPPKPADYKADPYREPIN